nr:hypothetical protein [Cellulosimicrobium sp. MM]
MFATSIPQRPRRPVQREQHETGDDRGERERDVDEHLEEPLAGEPVAHEDPRDERAHDDVDGGHGERLT